jgi:hypothetical protein
MKKIIVAATAAFALALAPITSAIAYEETVGGTLWDIDRSYFGVAEAKNNDVFDDSYIALSDPAGTNFDEYSCRLESLMSTTTIGSGKVVTCNELVTVQPGLNVRGFAYIYPDGLNVAVTYKITNTTGASIPFKWFQSHNYGNPQVSYSTYASVFSTGDGTSNGTSEAAAVAWGPTTQVCSAAVGEDDENDNMDVTSEPCTLAAGASMGITIFHKVGTVGGVSALTTAATALYVTRNADATLAAGIPAGFTNGNWGITGTLDVSGVPAAADPYDGTSMTLTGDAVLGSDMTVAFKNGETPVGTYYDVWMCPNKDVKPIDGVIEGDCVAVTFWERELVANYDQNSTALTMTWRLANEDVPGLIAPGGASYLDGAGDPILMGAPEDADGWCAYEGWYIIVNDYDGGAHSNWSPALGAAGCSEPAAGLASTGADVQQTGLIGLFALLAGLGVVVARRRAVRSN